MEITFQRVLGVFKLTTTLLMVLVPAPPTLQRWLISIVPPVIDPIEDGAQSKVSTVSVVPATKVQLPVIDSAVVMAVAGRVMVVPWRLPERVMSEAVKKGVVSASFHTKEDMRTGLNLASIKPLFSFMTGPNWALTKAPTTVAFVVIVMWFIQVTAMSPPGIQVPEVSQTCL